MLRETISRLNFENYNYFFVLQQGIYWTTIIIDSRESITICLNEITRGSSLYMFLYNIEHKIVTFKTYYYYSIFFFFFYFLLLLFFTAVIYHLRHCFIISWNIVLMYDSCSLFVRCCHICNVESRYFIFICVMALWYIYFDL